MKAYFVLRDFLLDSLHTRNVGIMLRSYKIDGQETLTTQFFADTQGEETSMPEETYDFCKANPDGSSPVATIVSPNSYNPFWYHFGTTYDLTNGLRRGIATGTQNGNDYGQGVLKWGVDIPGVLTGSDGFLYGAFYLDIDFTKSLDVSFDIVTSLVDGNVFEEPQILRRYKIGWHPELCYKEFAFFSEQTQMTYIEDGIGFLSGITDPGSDKSPFIDLAQFCQSNPSGDCVDKERTRSYALLVNIPTDDDVKDRVNECCYRQVVFAQAAGNDYEKNDFTGVYHQRQVPNETCDFFLINLNDPGNEIPLANTQYGTYKNFGSIASNPDLKYYILAWQKVLQILGEGVYTILKRVTIAGIQYEEAAFNFTLKGWNSFEADKTVRMDVDMDGYLQRKGVNFKNSGFKASLRFPGFFGRREPKHVEDNLIDTGNRKNQISMNEQSEYTMQSNNLPFCATSYVIDFLLFGNAIYFNDYNWNNHNRNIVKFAVTFGENKGMTYNVANTKAKLNLTFTERTVDNWKRNY